jgi:hypothetical protein
MMPYKDPENARKRAKEYYWKNRDKILTSVAEWAKDNRDKRSRSNKKYRDTHPDGGREYRAKNKEIIRGKKIEYWQNNKDKFRDKRSKSEYKSKINANLKVRRKVDTMFIVKYRLRNRIVRAARGKMSKHTAQILGTDLIGLKSHIESLFCEGMSWNNIAEWHIDHIVPLASATNTLELEYLSHFTNLQPMWARENQRKSDSMDHLQSPWPRVA